MIDITHGLIFIVDDDKMVGDALRDVTLSKFDVQVKVYTDDSFLQDPEIEKMDLLIIDIKMPNNNGIQLAYEAMKKKFCPVLFISGYEFNDIEEDIKHYFESIEIYDFISKPVPPRVFINRIKLLLSGMRYSCVVKDKEDIENRFWALLKNMIGIYCIFTDMNGNIIYADNQFIKDIKLENPDNITKINLKQIILTGSELSKDIHTRQDIITSMYDVNGKLVSVVKWFSWYINSHSNLFLTIGIPVVKDVSSVDSVYEYYKSVISNDKAILEILKNSERIH